MLKALITISHFPIHNKTLSLYENAYWGSLNWWIVFCEIFNNTELFVLSGTY